MKKEHNSENPKGHETLSQDQMLSEAAKDRLLTNRLLDDKKEHFRPRGKLIPLHLFSKRSSNSASTSENAQNLPE